MTAAVMTDDGHQDPHHVSKKMPTKRGSSEGITPHSNLLSQVTGAVRRVEDLVVEDREVERQAQPDGVGGLHLGLGNVERVLVCLLRLLHGV